MPRLPVYLDIDVSDAQELIKALRAAHSPENFSTIMRRAITRTGNHVKTIVAKDASKHYNITQRRIKQDIGNPQMGASAGSLGEFGCSIPIKGTRIAIGGDFKASGGKRGWSGIKAGKRYKINAKILKGSTSTLPEEMSHQGGNPPFRNLSASRLNGVTFTRKTKERFPIARVAGIAVPQMPMNRAKDEIQKDTADMLMKRLEAEHNFIISRCR